MKITEENVVLQIKRKNEKALDFILSEYGWVIKTVTKKHLSQYPDLQEECMNDVLLAVWEKIDSYDSGKSTLKNWIGGVTRYKAIDCKRKYLRCLKETPMEDAEEMSALMREEILEQEISEEVEELLSFLSDDDRILFTRLFLEDETIGTVAADMKVKKSVIYNRISRGKKKIQKGYLEYRGGQAE